MLPPPKSSRTQGLLEPIEPVELIEPIEPVEPIEPILAEAKEVSLTPVRKEVTLSGKDIFRPVNSSTLNPVDGLRLGGGFEIGKRWYSDPLFFSGSGSTIRRNENGTTASIDINENGSRTQYRPSVNPFVFGTMSYGISSQNLNYRVGGGVAIGEKLESDVQRANSSVNIRQG